MKLIYSNIEEVKDPFVDLVTNVCTYITEYRFLCFH